MSTVTGGAGPRAWRNRWIQGAWTVSAAGGLLLGAFLALATIADVRALTRPLPPKPPEVARDIVIRNADDEAGRAATFRILLFSDEFRWRLSSHDRLEHLEARPQFSREMRAVLNDAKEIICVGASSEEMPPGMAAAQARAIEERRAARRAEQTALWVRAAVSRPIPIRKLNIGHHAPTRQRGDTSDQRRVVIILVLERDEQTNVDQALRAAMQRESDRAPIFDALLTRYSLGSRSAFTWVD